MVQTCAPDDIGVSVSYPLPGTRFYDRVKLELGEKQNWVDSDDLAMMYRATYVPEFYRALHMLVHLFGEIDEVVALDSQLLSEWRFSDGQTVKAETNDFANMMLRFESGLVLQFQVSWNAPLGPAAGLAGMTELAGKAVSGTVMCDRARCDRAMCERATSGMAASRRSS